MRKKFLIIHNKMAGRLKSSMLTRVLAQLEKQGADVTLKAADSVEEDIELARTAVRLNAVDAVVAAGGDSTIRGVAMGLVGTDMPLGVIPAGTGNVLAEEINLTRNPDKIAQTLISGYVQKIKPGLANGEPFLLMAGAGLDAQIVKDLDHGLKQRIRKAAYIGPTLRALIAKPHALSVSFPEDGEVDNRPNHSLDRPIAFGGYSAAFVVVTKVRHYGGRFVIAPDAFPAADELQVVMFMDGSRLGMIRALAGLAMGWNARLKKTARDDQGAFAGHIMKTRGVMIRPCKKVRIEAFGEAPTQIDGEWLGTCPLEIGISDDPVRLIVPWSAYAENMKSVKASR